MSSAEGNSPALTPAGKRAKPDTQQADGPMDADEGPGHAARPQDPEAPLGNKSKRSLFGEEVTREVQDIRDSVPLPAPGNPIHRNELVQLCVHHGWEEYDWVLQTHIHIPVATESDSTRSWTPFLTATRDQLLQTLAIDTSGDIKTDILLAVTADEFKSATRTLRATLDIIGTYVNNLDIIVFTPDEGALLPTARGFIDDSPWTMKRVCRVHRPLCREDGTVGWAYVLTSDQNSRSTGLTPTITTLRLLPPGVAPQKHQVSIPAPLPTLRAVQISVDLQPDLVSYLGLTGSDCTSIPGKLRRDTRVHFLDLAEHQVIRVLKRFSQTQHLAVMSIPEYTGEAFQSDPLVMEIWCRRNHKEQLAPYLWQEVRAMFQASGVQTHLQVLGLNKLRASVAKAEDIQVFNDKVLPELLARGFQAKDERTGQYISDTFSEASDCSASTTGSSQCHDTVILVDVPPWVSPTDMLQLLNSLTDVRDIQRMSWTPGDISRVAYKVIGDNLTRLQSATLVDPRTGEAMTTMSMKDYKQERSNQQEARKRRAAGEGQRGERGGRGREPNR